MAIIVQWTPEKKAEWDKWLETRPKIIKDMAEKLPPNRLYKLKHDVRVTLYSYSEDGTVTVNVTGEYNRVFFNRRVFGIKPDDLEECDLPEPGESLGSILDMSNDISNDISNAGDI